MKITTCLDFNQATLHAYAHQTVVSLVAANVADDEPAATMDVTADAARLLGMPLPPLMPFEQTWAAISPVGRSFCADGLRVADWKTQKRLGLRWQYPRYCEELRAVLAGEQPAG